MFNIGGELSEPTCRVLLIHLAVSPMQNTVSRNKKMTFEPLYVILFHACADVSDIILYRAIQTTR